MARYLGAYKRAAEDGVDLAGYFRMVRNGQFVGIRIFPEIGLVYTDYNTQKRIWKDSAYFYKNIIETKRRESVSREVAHDKSEGQKEKCSSFYLLKKQ